ncbi:uncharacterized protein LOC115045758 [Echeneis naucrates]|uniref:uncharacterized protein LOC115045758 n=1 Tax=Echeneis naucrates TaxID=173247 RepID=UPI001113B6D9|nr:uncharacterized protein LOC115045758 [Echeneis naucrates]
MNISHLLLFCVFSALCCGESGLISANGPLFTGPEGGNGRINCHFNRPGSRMSLCRNKCKDEDILIRTDKSWASNGKYSIRYKEIKSHAGAIVSVLIRNLTQSDSGWYFCGLGGSTGRDSFEDFEIRVSNELSDRNSNFILTNIEGKEVKRPCSRWMNRTDMFFCRGKCEREEDILIETNESSAQKGRYSIMHQEGSTFSVFATITDLVKSDSGQYRCGYGKASSPESFESFLILVDAPTTKPTTSFSSGRSTMSTDFPEATSQPSSAASKRTTTTTTTTTTQTPSTHSRSSTTSPVSQKESHDPATADAYQFTAQDSSSNIPPNSLPTVVAVSSVGVTLLASSLLLFYIHKMKKKKEEQL